MVTRNRYDSNERQWWDELPPDVRGRISPPSVRQELGEADEAQSPVTGSELVRDLGRLALLFGIITIANMLFLLVALSFVAGR